MKKLKINPRLALVAGGAAATLWLFVNRRLFTVNDVTTGQSQEYSDLKPHAYAYPAAQVFAIVEAIARELPKWSVTNVDRLGREVQAEVRVLRVVDDVTIRVDPIPGSSICEVVMRSRSRFGTGDLGENARRIRAFYRALDERVRLSSKSGKGEEPSIPEEASPPEDSIVESVTGSAPGAGH